ncbi:MAG TPA: nucleotide exchange factor GrpE [Syntrophales bacterium]|nr:nucleotide exchange factor GrpE [Syntrophales bacterium]
MGHKAKKEVMQETPAVLESEGEEEQKTSGTEDIMLKLQEKEKEAAENYDKYVRAVAELENYRKRAAKEKAESIKYGNENIIRDILPLVDSMDRALQHAENYGYSDSFKKGLKLLQDQLLGCLGKHGVEQIDCVDKTFDPNLHEAVYQVDSAAHEGNKVVEELEKGYRLHDRLLRPAKVSISKRAKKENTEEL